MTVDPKKLIDAVRRSKTSPPFTGLPSAGEEGVVFRGLLAVANFADAEDAELAALALEMAHEVAPLLEPALEAIEHVVGGFDCRCAQLDMFGRNEADHCARCRIERFLAAFGR